MWHSIAEVKNYVREKNLPEHGFFVGAGPSADKLALSVSAENIVIGVNRSICLYPNFDFVFIDGPKALHIIAPYLCNTDYVCMPVWSNGQLNINLDICKTYRDKILLFSWVYGSWAFLEAPEYSLNDIHLFIDWGCAQSALHFAKKLGLKSLDLIGCDGGPVHGVLYAQKLINLFPDLDKIRESRQRRSYRKIVRNMAGIARTLGLEIHNLSEFKDVDNDASNR